MSDSKKVVVITGATKGIGLAIAEALVDAGHRLAIMARDPNRLDGIRDRLISRTLEPDQIVSVVGDVREEADIKRLFEAARGAFGRVDAVVANVGLFNQGPFEKLTTEAIDGVLRTEVRGMLLTAREAIPHLREAGGGSIVLMSSDAGLRGRPNLALHSTAKFAITGLGEALFEELRGQKIKVTVLCPHETDTWGAPDPEHHLRPMDVGEAVAYVLSAAANNAVARVELRAVTPKVATPSHAH